MVPLELKPIIPGGSVYRKVGRLYRAAFGAEVRPPLLELWLLSARREAVSLRAWYEGETFCGMTLTVDQGKYLYIEFIAVDPALRSRGYGGRMLARLRADYPDRAMLVEVEEPEPDAGNHDQRRKRIDFYQRNGFFLLEQRLEGKKDNYVLMSTDPVYDRAAFLAIFPHLSLGIRAGLRRIFRG